MLTSCGNFNSLVYVIHIVLNISEWSCWCLEGKGQTSEANHKESCFFYDLLYKVYTCEKYVNFSMLLKRVGLLITEKIYTLKEYTEDTRCYICPKVHLWYSNDLHISYLLTFYNLIKKVNRNTHIQLKSLQMQKICNDKWR